MAVTKDTLLSLAKKLISSRNNKIDLSSGTVLSDLGVDATAQVLASLSVDIDRVIGQQSLNSEYFTDAEADLFCQPFGLVRKQATQATGTVTFATNELPSVDSPITIPVGTRVYASPESTSSYYYTTTTSGTLTNSSPLNPNTGYYEVTVNIQAVAPGSAYNVGIGYINGLDGSISGISAVYNKDAVVNGMDIETTAALLDRFILMWRGRNRNTEPGILAWTYENPSVEEAKVIGPNSDFSIRGPGGVDVYIRGTIPASYTQTVTVMSKEVLLEKQPVINMENLYVTVDGINYTEEDGLFAVVKDTNTIYQGSVDGHDKIVWTVEGHEFISHYNSYTITYSYNTLITDVQNEFDTSEDRLITGDILARETYQENVVMEFGITPLTGYDKSATIALVKSNIEAFVNNTPLNTDLKQSDIVAIVEGTDGVSFMELPFLQFHKVGEDNAKKWVADIDASPLVYLRISSDDLIIG